MYSVDLINKSICAYEMNKNTEYVFIRSILANIVECSYYDALNTPFLQKEYHLTIDIGSNHCTLAIFSVFTVYFIIHLLLEINSID